MYGVWYLYLLTGKAEYLEDAMETLGSCVQLIDGDGRLRWSFVPDPCIDAGLWLPDGEGKGRLQRCTFGETYLDMISGWYRAPEGKGVYGYLAASQDFETDEGGCCDNDVHECFKAVAEVALPYGYVYESDGGLCAMNGTVCEKDGVLEFTPREGVIHAVHLNLSAQKKVRARFGATQEAEIQRGWLYADGSAADGLPEMGKGRRLQ